MVLNVVLNFILIPVYGIIGSAIATLISYSTVTFIIFYHREFALQFKMMMKSLFGITLIEYIRHRKIASEDF
jgi:O-antigen/teichoic acid export membrane protein